MNKLTYILGFVLILLTSFTTAYVGDIGAYYKDECLSLPQQGEGLTSCTIINVISPNSTAYANNETMTKSGDYFYKTFCNTTQRGEYLVNGKCSTASETDNFVYKFRVVNADEDILRDLEDYKMEMLAITIILGLFGGFFIWFAVTGYKYFNMVKEMEGFVQVVSINLALILIPFILGFILRLSEGKVYEGMMSTLYIISWYIFLAIIMINLIVALWSFVPWLVKEGFRYVGNK